MSSPKNKILAVNPDTYFTRIAVYNNSTCVFFKTIQHKEKDLEQFKEIPDQLDYRYNIILDELKNNDIDKNLIKIIVSRGGLVEPLASGIYRVNDKMKKDLIIGVQGQHANNLGGLIANKLASQINGAEAIIVDPVVVDEMDDVARVSGHPAFERRSIFHALSQKYVAHKYAESKHTEYEKLRLIVVHIAGGISVGAHSNGRVVDVNQALDGNGPFSFTRSGSLPIGDVIRKSFGDEIAKEELLEMITDAGGLSAYLNIKNLYELEELLDKGDSKAEFYTYAMAYQVAKEIGAMYTVLSGDVDAILISGKIFHQQTFQDGLLKHVDKIAPVVGFPHADEMEALAISALRVLKGDAIVQEY